MTTQVDPNRADKQDEMTLKAMRSQVDNLVPEIAKSLMGIGGHLECNVCGHIQPLDESAMADRLRDGWPKHHGYTMTWITKNQLAQRDVADREVSDV